MTAQLLPLLAAIPVMAAAVTAVLPSRVAGRLVTLSIPAAELDGGISLAQLFVRAGLAKSGKDARRLIAEGGARVNDQPAAEGQMVSAADLAQPMKLTSGRKRHALIVAE